MKNLKNFFNLSMTYTRESELPFLYGKFSPVVPHPTVGEDLDKIIRDFADSNTHLAGKENGAMAAQFVSHCKTASGRYVLVISVTSTFTYRVSPIARGVVSGSILRWGKMVLNKK